MSDTNQITLTKSGVYLAKGAKDPSKIADYIRVCAIGLREVDRIMMVHLRFKTLDGRLETQFVRRSIFQHPQELKDRLADLGYEWPGVKVQSDGIVRALAECRPRRTFRMVPAPGWYGDSIVVGKKAYSTAGFPERFYIDPSSLAHSSFVFGSGGLDDWSQEVAAPSRYSHPLMLCIMAACAAPFLRPLDMNSFAINWFGPSSIGKTSLLHVASSVTGQIGDRGLPGWADTSAGLEGLCWGHRDFAIVLDETGDAGDETELAKKAKNIAFAVARNRPRRRDKGYETNNALLNAEYRVILLSSSERALNSVANSAGRHRLTGEEVRLIDIPAFAPGSQGIFDRPVPQRRGMSKREAAGRRVDGIKLAAKRFQGHAIRRLLKKYTTDPNGLEKVRAYMAHFERRFRLKSESNVHLRIRGNFALMYAAGRLGIDYGVLPWRKSDVYRAVADCLDRALGCLKAAAKMPSPRSRSTRAETKRILRRRLKTATILSVRSREAISKAVERSRQAADGFCIENEIFVRRDVLRGWLTANQLRQLRSWGLIRTQRDDTDTILKKVAGVPSRLRYYALQRQALKRRRHTGR